MMIDTYLARMKRVQAFCETGGIGAYDADELHNDMRWLFQAYQELRGAVAMVAVHTPTPDADPWQDLAARADAFGGMQRLAKASLAKVDKL